MKKKPKRRKKYVPPKTEPKSVPMPTSNASQLHGLMKARKVKGRYKDFVIIYGSRLIDWLGSYEIRVRDGDEVKKYGVDGMALIHKSKLKSIIGAEAAEKFWKNGMRTNFGVESRRDRCAKKR